MRYYFLAGYSLLTLAVAKPLVHRAGNSNGTTSMVHDFLDVPTSPQLKWVPCFNNFTCANLEVPLDYNDTTIGTTNIAFIRKDSLHQPALGDVLVNPGGPGGSGVSFVLDAIPALENLLGDRYNIVGMDPRGVNNSGPDTSCFPGKPALRDFYDYQYYSRYNVQTEIGRKAHFQEAGAFGEFCSKVVQDKVRYANTPAAARDMLQYAELLAESKGESKAEAKLNYYGVSYGSSLGTTFAELFPDRVGRIIIDGVADVEDYYNGSWTQNLLQADEAVLSFFDMCFHAGPACAFFRNDSSPAAIKTRFDAVLTDLEKLPLIVSDPYWVQYPAIIGRLDFESLILLSLYDSVNFFPILAGAAASLEMRNGTALIPLLQAFGLGKSYVPKSDCDTDVPRHSSVHPKLIIACNDMNGRYNISTLEKWDAYIEENRRISSYVGDAWSPVITINCRSLRFSPPASQAFKEFSKNTTTNHPILFTTNTIDPVTSSAEKMSSFFPGSVVLNQNATGHGVIAAKSNCTSGHMQHFMETGTLPPAGTFCDIDIKPFQSLSG